MKLRRWLIFFGAALLIAGFSLSWAWDDYFASLNPLDLTVAERTSPVVLDRDGKLLRAFTMTDGRWRLPVTAQEVDQRFVAMLLAYEDQRFYAHHGVDAEALARAALQFATRGHIISGGSTLTMQVARLLEPRKEKSIAAKVRQMARALQLESQYAKPVILNLYLVLAPYGGNIEGVRAASLAYFGKEPKRLSIAEAALLVAAAQGGFGPER
ncbi:transglycosylase domain-containing protein, partial [uncultured Methylovirgula sp.]|uniref:transglycosylase domain-containing protein n=1 Tax=uncultured Methylovirgula sp. TaxID=1285960 RepID=UPI0026331D00